MTLQYFMQYNSCVDEKRQQHIAEKKWGHMEEYLKGALEIVKAQAGVRAMTEEEMIAMVQKLTTEIKTLCTQYCMGESDNACGAEVSSEAEAIEVCHVEPKKAIKEKAIVCCECGKSFKIITKRHLAQHGLTPETYREKYGYAKGTPLACKNLQRMRRNKMKDMKLWERRKPV